MKIIESKVTKGGKHAASLFQNQAHLSGIQSRHTPKMQYEYFVYGKISAMTAHLGGAFN
jgi:hypothetical protein